MADSVQYKSLPEVLYCKTCNYYTCNKKQIEKHFLSNKHIKNISISVELAPPPPSVPPPTAEEPAVIEDALPSDSDIPSAPPNTPTPLICECCGKIYKRKRALLRHQQSKQEEQKQEPETNSSLTGQENDNQALELISDGGGDDESSNIEFEYITIDPLILDPLIINNDVMYFLHAFMYSVDVVMGISVFVNKIFSFFSITSDDDRD
jgi:hypothetical protein